MDASNKSVRALRAPSSVATRFVVRDASADAASFEIFGSGCRGRLGVPALRRVRESWPRTSSDFVTEVERAPSGTAVLGFFGVTPTAIDLTALGAPNCVVRSDIVALVALPQVGTRYRWAFSIPDDVRLLGARFYQQALVLDVAANAFGLTVSTAARARIGF